MLGRYTHIGGGLSEENRNLTQPRISAAGHWMCDFISILHGQFVHEMELLFRILRILVVELP
jgi:hypothetical protein